MTQPASEIIERVKRAILAECRDLCREALMQLGDTRTDDQLTPLGAEERLARTAIAAMREPTEEMEEAADQPFHDEWKKQKAYSLKHYSKEAYASVGFSVPMWRAMIDEALK